MLTGKLRWPQGDVLEPVMAVGQWFWSALSAYGNPPCLPPPPPPHPSLPAPPPPPPAHPLPSVHNLLDTRRRTQQWSTAQGPRATGCNGLGLG